MKTPRLTQVDGFLLPPSVYPETFRASSKFKPAKNQVVVATFPKCGTTLTLQIVSLILRNGVPPADATEYFSGLPFMEMTPLDQLQNLRQDACIKTHLPFNRIDFSKDAKYIYVARHPADCAVSTYHHMRYIPAYFFSDGTFDDFFEIFVTGKTSFGDYFDHLLSWYEHRHEPNVFLITFEDLKSDPRGMILKIAKFLGDEYYQILKEDTEKILKEILEFSSVEYMRKNVDKYWEAWFATIPPEEVQKRIPAMKHYADIQTEAINKGHHSIGNFIRKGAVGDGKTTLSEDQKRRLECRIREKCAHSDVMDLWKRH